jgi:hypothetical protein
MARINRGYAIPLLLIVGGTGWLLNVLDVLPEVDWLWTLGLAALGVLTLAVGGIDRVTVALGPLLLVASYCSFLRQTGRLTMAREAPIITIVLGLLLLLGQLLRSGRAE